MPQQKVIEINETYEALDPCVTGCANNRLLLVCDGSISYLRIDSYFEQLEGRLGIKVVRFTDFAPNPDYESVVKGVQLFRREKCGMIAAVGGGSAMDVAKCIKLYARMGPDANYLTQETVPNEIPLIAVPTTAGTGSEATRYAVIYYKGEKQSVTSESCIPSVAVMDRSVLLTLPEYQRKATMLDALCHSVESYWSVNATEESKEYAREAFHLIMAHMDGYLANEPEGNAGMMRAAHLAGKAINITQTTAGHAMSYKLTSLYGIAHGHAAALCVAKLMPYMAEHLEDCIDPRGEGYLRESLGELAAAMGCRDFTEAGEAFQRILARLQLAEPRADEGDYDILVRSVNIDRLKNHPVKLDREAIESLYRSMLNGKG